MMAADVVRFEAAKLVTELWEPAAVASIRERAKK